MPKINLSGLQKIYRHVHPDRSHGAFFIFQPIFFYSPQPDQYRHPEHLLHHRCDWAVVCDDRGRDRPVGRLPDVAGGRGHSHEHGCLSSASLAFGSHRDRCWELSWDFSTA